MSAPTQWSDGEKRDKNETARLRYRQEEFAKAVAPYQEAELGGLRFMNDWLRQVSTKQAKIAHVGGGNR